MAVEHQPTLTIEEYFQLEEQDPDKRYEYIDGQDHSPAVIFASCAALSIAMNMP